MKRLTILLALSLALALGGCGNDDSPRGTVATVNGKPVSLGDVEFTYDLRHMDSGDEENPAVERLRDEYGEIAAGLIVQELIFQELTKSGNAVTDAECQAAEDQVRADYPGGAFDQMLVEENIDLAKWRQAIRARLAIQKFERQLLANKIKIGVQEAADYYKEHREDFSSPAKIAFALIQGPDPETVKKAAERLGELRNEISGFSQSESGVTVQKAVLRPEALPPAWAKALDKLSPGQAAKPLSEDGQTRILILLERMPAKTLDAAQAYPLVEERLKEKKLRAAFADWLENVMRSSVIKVSSRLLPSGGDGARTAGGPALDDFGSRLPLSTEGLVSPAENETVRKTVAEKMRAEIREDANAGASEPGGPDEAEPERKTAPAPVPAGGAKDAEKAGPAANAQEPAKTVEPDGALAEPSASEKAPGDVPDAGKADAAAPESPSAEAQAQAPVDAGEPPLIAENAQTQAVASTKGQDAQSQPQAPEKDAAQAPAQAGGPDAGPNAGQGPGEVTFTANKASWVILTADDGKEERVYLKGGKSLVVPFKRSLKAQFGSPSDVTYSYNGRETRVEASTKDVKTAAFP